MTNNTVKLLRSLHQKKYRNQTGLFLVEGAKSVVELLHSELEIEKFFYTEKFEHQYTEDLRKNTQKIPEIEKITQIQLQKISTLKTNNTALAVVKIPAHQVPKIHNEFALALADIRDPGNLGTIIRVADWYNISKIICSKTCVSWHNPKTIAASMGSFCRVQPFYLDLISFLSQTNVPILGACMSGISIHEFKPKSEGIILIGNESQGVPRNLFPLIDHQITIPRFGQAESLNAGIATAIICDNFARMLS